MDKTVLVTAQLPPKKSFALLYGDETLRGALEREIFIAQRDYILEATPENFIELKTRLLTLKNLYEKCKSDFSSQTSFR